MNSRGPQGSGNRPHFVAGAPGDRRQDRRRYRGARFEAVILLLVLFAALAYGAEFPRQTAGRYRVTLRLPAEGLFAQEESQVEFRIEDLSRPDPLTEYAPVVRLVPQAVIDMPAMPRMPSIAEAAHAEPAPGDYGIHPTFAHGGEFRLRIAVVPGTTVEFPLQVQDATARRKPVPPRFTLELSAQPKKPRAGEPVDLRFQVRDGKTPVTSFETVHEKLLHLILVRRDLTRFAHEHPQPNADGTFTLRYTFPAPGEYRLFADTAPAGAGSQILSTVISVSGKDSGPLQAFPELTAPGRFPARKTVPISLPVDAKGLEPWLGAIGHLLLIHQDAQTFVHAHPDDSGTLTFLTRFPKPGLYRGWLQYQTSGQLHTLTLTLHAD
jgi:hypothetical protein